VRKFLIPALVAGSMAVTGVLAALPAHAYEPCTTGASTSGVAVQTPAGCASASGSAATQSGYVQADGAPTNPNPLGGYVAVDSNNGGEVVGCSTGDYSQGSGNVIVSASGGPTPPSATDPCNPSPGS